MELFSVACSTCRARLKVCDQAAIGQILGCPKCGGMVQVVAPAGWHPPAHETPAAGATTITSRAPATGPRWRDEVAPPRDTPPAIAAPSVVVTALPPRPATIRQRSAWLPWAMVPAAAVLSALGVWFYLERDPPKPSVPAVDGVALRAEIEQLREMQRQAAVAAPPQQAVAPPAKSPVADTRRWLAPAAQAAWTLRPDTWQPPAGPTSTADQLAGLWNDQLQALAALTESKLTDIERVTWSTSDLATSQATALVELRLRAPIDARAGWVTRLQPDKLGDQPVWRATQGGWRHPVLLVGTHTIVSGPTSVLAAAIERHAVDVDSRTIALERLLLDDATLALGVELPAARARGWFAGLDPTRWGLAPERWQQVRNLPTHAGVAIWLGGKAAAELRLTCASPADGEQVRRSIDDVSQLVERRLASFDMPSFKQAITSLRARQVSFSDDVVRMRVDWTGDPAGLAELATLIDTPLPARPIVVGVPASASRPPIASQANSLSPSRSGLPTARRVGSDVALIVDEPSAEVEAQLATRIPAIDLQDLPLVDFVRLVSDLSGVTITIDADGFQEARVRLDQPLTVRQQDTPLGELLDHALADYGLAIVGQGKRLVITSSASRLAGLRRTRLRVTDLKPTKAGELAPLIAALVEPTSWVGAGGAGRIEVDGNDLAIVQTARVAARVTLLLDRLRAARGQPPVSHLADEGSSSETRLHRASTLLAQPVSLNFHEPVELADLLKPLGKQAGVEFIFDEPGLASAGRSPRSPVSLAADHWPLADVLARLLTPGGLDYRVVGKNLIQITGAEALRNRAVIEFYPIADLLRGTHSPEEAIQRLIAASDNDSSLVWQAWRFDAPSTCLLVLADEPAHRATERALARWRSSTAAGGQAHDVLKPTSDAK